MKAGKQSTRLVTSRGASVNSGANAVGGSPNGARAARGQAGERWARRASAGRKRESAGGRSARG